MVPIKVDLIKKAKRPGYAMKPEYITIHQTGNTAAGADAAMHNKYVHNVAPNPSWHFTVDDKEAYQHLPLTENGWHAGDGTNGPGNRNSIGIEICINRDGNLAKAEANGAWLAAKLIKEVKTLKPFPGCMKQHYDWSGKDCPAQIRARTNGWANFLKQVEGCLGQVVGTPIIGPAQATVEQAQAWAKSRGAAGEFIGVAVLYWQEAPKRGGVKPEVAYVQAAKETRFGKFGGVIPGPEWHNWCGLKTTAGGDNSDPGAHARFPDDTTGVRAHLDHLAIYAGAPGYPRADSPDPRHFPYIAGTAKTVEALGGKWAPAAEYGESLVRDYLKPLLAISTPEPVAPAPLIGDVPKIAKVVGVEVDGKVSGEVGYLIENSTYLRVAYLIKAVGGQVTGHGDHVKITLPAKIEAPDVKEFETEIAALKKKIENAKAALS